MKGTIIRTVSVTPVKRLDFGDLDLAGRQTYMHPTFYAVCGNCSFQAFNGEICEMCGHKPSGAEIPDITLEEKLSLIPRCGITFPSRRQFLRQLKL
jgi:hypothetical protein